MTVVALALSDGVPLYELAAPCAIFGTDRSDLVGSPWYRFEVCAPADARVDRWFRATTEHTYDDLVAADTVVVPACHDGALRPPDDLVDAVRAAFERGARVISICTGAFVLAAAGLLDGRRAATHWLHAETLAKRHPAITVDANALYVDEGRVLTSAGKAAGTDLCLHVVRLDHGAAVANEIARLLVTPPHREGGQAQYVASSSPRTSYDELATVMDWALDNLGRPITIEQLAQHAHLGVRTLNRHFHARVGTNPSQWLQSQRVRRAQHLLEQTGDSVESIAGQVGFGTAAALRRHFRQVLGTSPDTYRRAFTRKAAAD
ncbi:helix-turn-helix domain-containing protein [Amycolatopsis mongoliensis]|uniref:Helix-turn-helix domain-containing protein n=1 Tax=Amycolatopsis mongoliensis TaxID=715475 RepID=A0A9Y2NBI7_9PSEU|nr:helix-turn-helix domain-containing protein [Amycolatopsis sp. 4-36]WIX98531.1 helix-turn-helix domain-containing protein [Amycolatopsis sp. 4-36]